jgi:hypothetical protein
MVALWKQFLLVGWLSCCMPVYATGYLVFSDSKYTYNQTEVAQLRPVTAKYQLTNSDVTYYVVVEGYSHCENSIFMLQHIDENGNPTNLLFDNEDDAIQFEKELNTAIGPGASADFMVKAYAELYDVVAVPYVKRVPITLTLPGGAKKNSSLITIKLHYLKNKNNRSPESDGCVF